MKYTDCPGMLGAARNDEGEKVCRRCSKALVGRQEAWCSKDCVLWWQRNHWFTNGSRVLKQGDPRCVLCGEAGTEVDHIERANGAHSKVSCIHHLDNLRVLCTPCHRAVTNAQLREDAERRRSSPS